MLGTLGFDASVKDGRLELSSCPCSTVAPDRPELMCMLAEGVVQGALSAAGSGQRATDFHHDPASRHCTAELAERE